MANLGLISHLLFSASPGIKSFTDGRLVGKLGCTKSEKLPVSVAYGF